MLCYQRLRLFKRSFVRRETSPITNGCSILAHVYILVLLLASLYYSYWQSNQSKVGVTIFSQIGKVLAVSFKVKYSEINYFQILDNGFFHELVHLLEPSNFSHLVSRRHCTSTRPVQFQPYSQSLTLYIYHIVSHWHCTSTRAVQFQPFSQSQTLYIY